MGVCGVRLANFSSKHKDFTSRKPQETWRLQASVQDQPSSTPDIFGFFMLHSQAGAFSHHRRFAGCGTSLCEVHGHGW